MRTRTWLAGAALTAAMLTGAATGTAHATEAAPQKAYDTKVLGWLDVGVYYTEAACRADGQNSAQTWRCVEQGDGSWLLQVWV